MKSSLSSILILSIVAFFSISENAEAVLPTCDSSAVLLDTAHVTVKFEHGPLSTDDSEVDVWYILLAMGMDTIVVVDPESIEFVTAGAGIDTVSTDYIMDQIALAVIARKVEELVISSTSNCSLPSTIDVHMPKCVVRTGSGASTTFVNVDACDRSTRMVEHCLVNGIASTGIVSTSGCTSCSTGEATWSSGGGTGIE